MAKRTRAERRKNAKRIFKNILWGIGKVLTLGLLIRNNRRR